MGELSVEFNKVASYTESITFFLIGEKGEKLDTFKHQVTATLTNIVEPIFHVEIGNRARFTLTGQEIKNEIAKYDLEPICFVQLVDFFPLKTYSSLYLNMLEKLNKILKEL